MRGEWDDGLARDSGLEWNRWFELDFWFFSRSSLHEKLEEEERVHHSGFYIVRYIADVFCWNVCGLGIIGLG